MWKRWGKPAIRWYPTSAEWLGEQPSFGHSDWNDAIVRAVNDQRWYVDDLSVLLRPARADVAVLDAHLFDAELEGE